MIKPSPELLAVARRWYKTILERDFDGLKNFMSESEHLRFVGTSCLTTLGTRGW